MRPPVVRQVKSHSSHSFFRGSCPWKIQFEDNTDVEGEWQLSKVSKETFYPFFPVPGHAQSIQTVPGTSFSYCFGLALPSRPHSLFLLTIPKQDQESLSAPCTYCLCLKGASFRSVGTMQTQDCYTWSWSCKSWIFYGSFMVRLGPN